ncbi:MAG: FAD-dependent oxidoreductase [Gemmatimonadetes bacterium]|nr:FAD-dependent oxidoreductase [Gemmatimonadota bacterium]
MSRVVVIGGGVVGLATAYHLARRGTAVTVIDRGRPGDACSKGNLGWICPSLSHPVPAPGLTVQSLKWMLHRDSPLYIDPAFALSSAGWLWRFWRHCNQHDYHHGMGALSELNRRAFALYNELRADGVQFEMHEDGMLFLFLTDQGIERSFAEFQAFAELGLAVPSRLDREGVRAAEPRLAPDVRGGVRVLHERRVRPETLCAGLLARVQALGGEVRSGVSITGMTRRGTRATMVETAEGRLEADAFVLAAGSWSGHLAKSFGFSLPIQPGKGYSITITGPEAAPSHAVYLYEMRVGVSPFNGAMRLGGTMELSGLNDRIVPERVAAIRRAAARYLPGSTRGAAEVEWTGMRPLTPDGLPAIGRAPGFDNLYVATGHAMLGMTMAPVTGLAVAELVTGQTSSFDLKPFDPGRFQRR